jgi:8-oxo-dGTP pyrophosphatase MutT (NUDIX family)
MKPRPAVKGIIPVEHDRFIFVVGESGRLNLPGGAPVAADSNDPLKTFLRESREEIGLGINDLSNIRPAFPFPLRGAVTSCEGIAGLAIWTVFKTDACEVEKELFVPSGSEVTDITCLTAEECFAQPDMSGLAKAAMYLYARF